MKSSARMYLAAKVWLPLVNVNDLVGAWVLQRMPVLSVSSASDDIKRETAVELADLLAAKDSEGGPANMFPGVAQSLELSCM